MDTELPIRVVVIDPPPGYAYCLQKGQGARGVRLDYEVADSTDLQFELEVTARDRQGHPDFAGPFVQGIPNARFVYLCVGEDDTSHEPLWSGRVKIQLGAISRAQIEQLASDPSRVLEARYQGSNPYGGPALATVPLEGGWQVVARERSAVA